uniref:Calcineurin-like phosphoesterase domain-containing protein n=1 Tax=Colobus angolensis palliatus TaxID=336983 RepID=A0A2K5JGX9_COLAP
MAMIELGFGRQSFHPLKRKSLLLLKLIAVVFAVLLFCEFLIYYLAIFQCNWPEVNATACDGEQATREPALKAMFLADTHLLGEFLGHWLDKLRREWQMQRAFQTALWLLQPEVVFILGDVFDEGKWSTPEFVMVNSVALNGDGCGICSEAEAELIEVSHRLNCSREARGSRRCGPGPLLPMSAPILLQHYPLYRKSDANCSGEDAAPPEERDIPFKENYDVLSREASQK